MQIRFKFLKRTSKIRTLFNITNCVDNLIGITAFEINSNYIIVNNGIFNHLPERQVFVISPIFNSKLLCILSSHVLSTVVCNSVVTTTEVIMVH